MIRWWLIPNERQLYPTRGRAWWMHALHAVGHATRCEHVVVAGDCVFCRIVGGGASTDLVFEDDVAVAFLDHSPLLFGHTLVVPRQHVMTLADLPPGQVGQFFRRVQHLSAELPRVLGAEGTFVANNNVVSQSVAHLHVHVVPRRRGDGLRGFFWPRTKYGEGESARLAARLRHEMYPYSD